MKTNNDLTITQIDTDTLELILERLRGAIATIHSISNNRDPHVFTREGLGLSADIIKQQVKKLEKNIKEK